MAIGSHTWEILESLTESEASWFEETITSPKSLRDNNHLRLFNIYMDAETHQAAIQKLSIYHSRKGENDLNQRVFLSRFFKKLKSFLSTIAIKNHWWKDILLLDELHKRKLHKTFLLCFRQMSKSLEAKKERSFTYYRQKFELESLHQNQLLQFHTKPDTIPYENAVEAFENWWIHQKLSLACFSKGQKRTKDSDISHDLLIPEIFSLIQNDARFKNKPVLTTYKKLYLFLTNQSNFTLQDIKNEVIKHIYFFSQEEKHNLFAIIYNHHVKNFNFSRSENDGQELLTFFEWGLEEKVLLSEDRISWDFYRNILEICILLKKFKKAESYLEDLYSNLSEVEKEEIFPYFQGRLLFGESRYSESIFFLNKTFVHPLLEVNARFFHLQALYELELNRKDWRPAVILTMLDAHGRFIRKSKHLKNLGLQEKYLKRYIFFRKLLKAKTLNSQEKLVIELQEERAFSGKKWILSKLTGKKLR